MPRLQQWNTFVEEIVPAKQAAAGKGRTQNAAVPMRLADIQLDEESRLKVGIGELDRVLGGGIVPGSLTLVGEIPA